jgi:2-phospho-L-lactate guanylyltransferase
VAVSWGVVVPVKRLPLAKSRLAAYGDAAREGLALAFAADVVLVAREVARVLVVTDDPAAAALLSALGAEVTPDDPDAGLNPALSHGADLLRAADPALGVATLSADLPALRAHELRAALDQVGPGRRAFVADVAGTGTTLLAAGPGAVLAPAFGLGSRAAHLASGAQELSAGPGLRHDVDTPEDLVEALRLGVGPRTRAIALGLP